MSLFLTLNAGSSSLKFAVYAQEAEPRLIIAGQVEKLGPDARLKIKGGPDRDLGMTDHARALDEILVSVQDYIEDGVVAVGHRIVHGGTDFAQPTELTPQVMDKLRLLVPLAPLHQPHNLACVDASMARFPDALQVGCFDTSFHRGHPWVNDTFAIPRRFYDLGVRRYGFHGLSYDFMTSELRRLYPKLEDGNVVIAHLGNGASICAVRDGASQASTMGFSALDGLPMGTRSGQVDPGVLLYLMDQHDMTPREIERLLYRESGLLGLSGISSDMRTLQASDAAEAKQAIDYYVFRIRREIGAMAASLGGIDGLVFCGGIGENSAYIRARVVEHLSFLGLTIDHDANNQNAIEIGAASGKVLVIPTDEERVIARALQAALPAKTA